MDKRTFLKIISAMTASPALSPLITWAAGDKLKNWAGNVDYSTENLYSATSINQVQEFVKKRNKLKVLGTRHCFNKIADSADYFLSLKEKDDETFLGSVVGLGALGVITNVTLDVQPTFLMRQYVYENLPLRQMQDHFDAIESSAYSVSLFTDWQKQRINEVWLKSRVEPAQEFHATPEFFDAKLATRNLHPIAELSAENCTEQMGVPGPWYERLPHFRMGFTPSAGKELQT